VSVNVSVLTTVHAVDLRNTAAKFVHDRRHGDLSFPRAPSSATALYTLTTVHRRRVCAHSVQVTEP
jgi:hypothetical protein